LRVLIASDLYWPTVNGVATFARNLAEGLAATGHDVAVVAPSQTGKHYVEADENHRVIRTRSLVFPFYQDLRMSVFPTREIVKFVEAFEPDVIHVQTPLGIGLGAIAAAKKCDVPLVATNHTMSENLTDNVKLLAPFAKPIDVMLRRYAEWFYSHACHVTMPTQAALNMLKPDDFRKPTSAISNGIDLSRFHPGDAPEGFRERFGIPRQIPVVLYVGRVDVEKHLSVLVQAARRLLGGRAFHLVIVGFGVDRHNLERLADSLDIHDHITFTGRIDEEDKPDFFRTATVFAMPSPAELQSISTLEAMASGLPVVAVNMGALPELCEDGHNGVLFDLDDADGLGGGLARILDDPQLAGSMGAASLEIAGRHDLSETIRQFVALYEQAVTGPSSR
jgi:glycosyltransferase involved in cell wall biosynthesis